MLKKFYLIAIIAVLAYSQVGYYFVIRHVLHEQKEAIEKKILGELKDEELNIISFTDNEKNIYWEEEGKEFLFKGEMYDVVRTKTVNGNVILYCINDKKEKALIDHHNMLSEHHASEKGKISIDHSSNLFVYEYENNSNIYFVETSAAFAFFDSCLSDNLIELVTPPPKA